MRITLTAANIREPQESEQTRVRTEPACNCYGEICNSCVYGDDGELESLPPHFHIIVSGEKPEASPRYYSVGVFTPE